MRSDERMDGGAESVLVRVSKSLRDRVQALAAQDRRTIGKQMEVLLEEPLAKAEAQGKGVRTPA